MINEFYKSVLSLWAERWRPELTALLKQHDLAYSRQSYWNWKTGKSPVPEDVMRLVREEKGKNRKA